MSASQRQMRSSLGSLESHFEKSLKEINAPKTGAVGRSANVQELIVGKLSNEELKRMQSDLARSSQTSILW